MGALVSHTNANSILSNIQANIVAGGNAITVSVTGTQINPGLQKLVAACLAEMSEGTVRDTFLEQLSHFNRPPSRRTLRDKFVSAGCAETLYEFAMEAKEAFAKFFEITARHPSGQAVLVAAFKHAYSVYQEKIASDIDKLTFKQQSAIFESDVVAFLSDNLTGLPEFYGRMEAFGLLFYLGDNCFIEYAKS